MKEGAKRSYEGNMASCNCEKGKRQLTKGRREGEGSSKCGSRCLWPAREVLCLCICLDAGTEKRETCSIPFARRIG